MHAGFSSARKRFTRRCGIGPDGQGDFRTTGISFPNALYGGEELKLAHA